MILPSLAAVLLLLTTVYSAIVSFRRQSAEEESSWIFPGKAGRTARITVILAMVALLAAFAAWLTLSPQHATRHSSRFLIAEGYTGWVRVEFEIPGASPLPLENGENVIRIPPSGFLQTSSPEEYGWAKDSFYYYAESGLHPLADASPARQIWGKINGEAYGSSDERPSDQRSSAKRKYEEFFVGTQEQFRAQAGEKSNGPRSTR